MAARPEPIEATNMRPRYAALLANAEDAHTATAARAHESPATNTVRALWRWYRRPVRRPRPV